jgi:hypothetical protein
MAFVKARKGLASIWDRDAAVVGRREVLAGIGLAGLVAMTAKLLLPSEADAKTLARPAASGPAEAAAPPRDEHAAAEGDTNADVTELSSRHHWHWRRHYWRRRYWHRRHWGWRRRHWGWHRRRHWGWRRRHWRRRYWRRRYW